MQKRVERLLAEQELRKSRWWREEHIRFFKGCMRPAKRRAVILVHLWLLYSDYFKQRGYWCNKQEFERQLDGHAFEVVNRGGVRVVLNVQLIPSFRLLLRKRPGEMNVSELRRHSGIPAELLASLRAAGVGPPCRELGREILYRASAYQRWLKHLQPVDIGDLVKRFAEERLRFPRAGDRASADVMFIPRPDLVYALDDYCRTDGPGKSPAGVWGELIRLLRAKGCRPGLWRGEYQKNVRTWRGVDLSRRHSM